MNVQAFISNISFPRTIEELRVFVEDVGQFNVEEILTCSETEWTVPKWAVKGDIVLFFHAKTAIQRIRHLKIILESYQKDYDYDILMKGLERSERLYKQYGGKIFAIGRILDKPYYDYREGDEVYHWKTRIYALINDIETLQNPVDINEFSNFIRISRQSAITPVLGEDFIKLRNIIKKKNRLPEFVMLNNASPLPLSQINKDNWMKLNCEYRRRFYLEIQFRKFYVDYLLSAIADQRKIFSECACYKNGKLAGYVDNCIFFHGKWCEVEVKLNFNAERDLIRQLNQYTDLERILLEKERECTEKIEKRFVIVIDTERIGIFDGYNKRIEMVAELDRLQNKLDLLALRKQLIDCMEYMMVSNSK